MELTESLAPGSRVRVRDEEWAVERCLPLPTGGYAVHVQGLSELVRGHQAIFLTTLDEIEPLRAEETRLVTDDSPGYRQTRLYLETLLRRTPPTDSKIHIGHRAAIELMDYQLVPARRALGEPTAEGARCIRPRILIADGTGLGKTIETGILLSELIKRGRGRRILVVTLKSLLAQFQRDLWARFTIPLVRLDSEGIRRVQAKIPSNRNPFSYYDRCIVSVDTLKNNGRYRAELEQIRWDVIVVDECQNVANRGSQREQLARLLASQCDALILTSATPHNGRPESFANLVRMLDPTAIANDKSFTRSDIEHLFVRRFKKDVEADAQGAFQEREVVSHVSTASAAEERALSALRSAQLHGLGRKRSGIDQLFTWTLVKAFLSSPQACLESIDNRIRTTRAALEPEEGRPHPFAEDLQRDLQTLAELRALVEAAAAPGAFTKLEALFTELERIGFDGTPSSPRVVIFSERIRTLEMLKEELTRRFRIDAPEERIRTFEASLPDTELMELKESFGRASSPLRVLLASDAASEGVNLHYHCNQLFHFDIPWSLIRLTQRNGRIDRFGQRKTPHLHYLLTRSAEQSADQQVVSRLIDREKVVHDQLGDAGALLGLYDADAEDEFITRAVAQGQSAESAIPDAPRHPPAEAPAEASSDDATVASSPDSDVLPLEPTSSALAATSPPEEEEDDDDIDLFAILDAAAAGAPLPPRGSAPKAPHRPAAPTSPRSPEGAPPPASGAPEEEPAIDIADLLAHITPPKAAPVAASVEELPTLFGGDYDFAVTALRQLERHPLVMSAAHPDRPGILWEKDDDAQALRIHPPESFQEHRAEFLPDEALPRHQSAFQLVARHDVVREKIREALEGDDGAWPEWHLLWEQHPLMEWMLDTLASAYARHEAPVLLVPSLGRRALYLFSTLVSNEDAQPVHTAWFAVTATLDEKGKGASLAAEVLSLSECLQQTGLRGSLVNPERPSKRIRDLEGLVPAAVERARQEVRLQREPILGELRKLVRKETRRLERWAERVRALLDAEEARYRRGRNTIPLGLEKKLNQKRANLERFRANHTKWLKSLEAHGAPYVRLCAVFSGD